MEQIGAAEIKDAVDAEDDSRLISWLVHRIEGLSAREAKRITGLSTGAITRYRNGQFDRLQPATRRAVAVFLSQPVPRGTSATAFGEGIDSEQQAQIEAILRNPNLVRRVLGQILPEHVNTRLAIWRAYEDDFVDAGIPIPEWMEEIRREIYARAPIDFRADSP